MRKLCVILLYLSLATSICSQTEVYSLNIRTIKLFANDDVNTLPVISLNTDEYITVVFDQLSQNYTPYRYTITHHNADWTESGVLEIDYLDGFNNNPIENYELSRNTIIPYTHYRVTLPNENFSFRISGNYMINVIDDNTNKIMFKAGFRVLDKKASILAKVSTDTDIDRNKTHQQVSFSVNHKGYTVRNAQSDIKVMVMQNRRTDNAVTNLSPSFVGANEIRYEHNQNLIFPAGNEYRRFEFVSTRYTTQGVEAIVYENAVYQAFLVPDKVRNENYLYDQDQNGRYLIRNAETEYSDTEADYFQVYFTLPWDNPLKTGKIYLNGDFVYNAFNAESEMIYTPEENAYTSVQLLKQGAYNYLYLYVPDGSHKGNIDFIEGNFYQTENEYSIFVYHRPFGERYDHLIGYTTVAINK